MNKIVLDLDNTIAGPKRESYSDCEPDKDVVARMREYKAKGFGIAIYTARNMRTFDGNMGLINVNTLPAIAGWLDQHDIPYDEIWVGKPWCGTDGFYVDDRAVRPDEFVRMTQGEIAALLGNPVSGNDALDDGDGG